MLRGSVMAVSNLVLPTIAAGALLLLVVALVALQISRPGVGFRDPDDADLAGRGAPWPGRRRKTRKRQRVRLLIGLSSLAVLGLVAVEGARWVNAITQLKRGADVVAQAAEAASHPASLSSGQARATARLRDEGMASLRPGGAFLASDPAAAVGRHLPWVGEQLVAVDDLAAAAVSAGEVVTDELKVADSYNAAAAASGPPGPRLLRIISDSAPALADVSVRLAPVLPNLRRDQQRQLLPSIASRVRLAVDRLGSAADQAMLGAAAARYAPAALGGEGPRTYLVLYENPAELRPAGGYVGAAGTVTFDKGAPAGIDIQTQDAYDFPRNAQHINVPYPLARFFAYTKKDSLQIGEAGWDPDFPSAARLSESVYSAATAKSVDGTISIDPYAVSALLKVTGPVTVPGYGEFNTQNFFTKVDFIVNVDKSPAAGKGALPVIATAILRQTLSAPASSWPRILTVFRDQSARRHIQIQVHDAHLQEAVARVHYDGAIQAAADDYLMVVDGNVGANKDDFYLQKSAALRVEVPRSGISKHQLVVSYDLPPPVDDTDRALNPGQGGYQDYVRFYLPESANLVSLTFTVDGRPGDGGLDAVTAEHGKRVISAFFRLQRGHKGEIKLNYLVGLRGDTYGLLVQKQAGIPDRPLSVQVSYPGDVLSRRLDLSQDGTVEARW